MGKTPDTPRLAMGTGVTTQVMGDKDGLPVSTCASLPGRDVGILQMLGQACL